MSEYKKDHSKENVDRTAKFLDRMLVEGRRDPATGRMRKATLQDIEEYLQLSDFDSVGEFNQALGVKYPVLLEGFDQFMWQFGNSIAAMADVINVQHGPFGYPMPNMPDSFAGVKQEYIERKKERDLAARLKRIEDPKAMGLAGGAGMLASIPRGMKIESALSKQIEKLGLNFPGSKTVERSLSVGGTGAIEGAAYGADDVIDAAIQDNGKALEQTIAMLYRGGAGALGALLGYGLWSGTQKAASPVYKMLGMDSDEAAGQILKDSITSGESEVTGRQYKTINDAIAELRERREISPQSQPVAADLNDSNRVLAQAVMEGMDDDVRNKGIKFLTDRQKGLRNDETLLREDGQAARIERKVEELSGIPESNLWTDLEVMKKKRASDADEGYLQAYSGSPVTDDTEAGQRIMAFMFEEPEFRAAYEKGFEINRKRRITNPDIPAMRPPETVFTPQNNRFSIVELDYTQRGYRDITGIKAGSTDPKNALGKDELDADLGVVQEFQELLRKESPKWGEVFDKYATDSKANRAFEEGYKALNKSPKAIEAAMESMTEGQRDFFKKGAAQAVYDFMGEGVTTGTNVARMFDDQPKKSAIIQQLFGSTQQLREFMKQILTENEAFKTQQFMNQWIPDRENQADAKENRRRWRRV